MTDHVDMTELELTPTPGDRSFTVRRPAEDAGTAASSAATAG